LNGELETIYILIRAIRACFHLMGNVGDDLHRQFGITASMRAVMESLYEGGPQTVPQVARSKNVTRQHIQALVDQLLEAGLSVAVANPDHKRSPLIELTARGHSAFEDMQRREQALLTQLTAALPARDLMIAVETIRKLNEQLQQLRDGEKENEQV
jgi:DNA-binding MarR family transcriptional regulator